MTSSKRREATKIRAISQMIMDNFLDTKQKNKTYHDCIAYSFLFEGCFCFLLFTCFPKHIKFGQNFVTKKTKQKTETWRLVPIYNNKYLQNFSCPMKRQGQGSLRCFKTKNSRHSKIKYTYIIYIITSFINSETTALLHLTSFTEDVTNIGFHMPIASIWNPGECPAQWYLGQFIGLIQNPVKHLGKSFGRNS